jgi:hypothetical protein
LSVRWLGLHESQPNPAGALFAAKSSQAFAEQRAETAALAMRASWMLLLDIRSFCHPTKKL